MSEFVKFDMIICISPTGNLTIGRIYEILSYKNNFVEILDDIGNRVQYRNNRFKKLDRREKLKRILNDKG